MIIGTSSNAGRLEIDGAVAKSNHVSIGYSSSNSQLIVENNGEYNLYSLSIGQSGVGEVVIGNGGKLTTQNAVYLINGYGNNYNSNASPNASAQLAISGVESSITTSDNIWMGWGVGGDSSVIVSNGGLLSVRSIVMRQATFVIDGVGSKVVATQDLYLRVTSNASSTFSISNGGVLQTNSVRIGESTDATLGSTSLNINGLNSKWVNSGAILIGYDGRTTNTVTIDGGSVQAGSVNMANAATGVNKLIIQNNGTLATSKIKNKCIKSRFNIRNRFRNAACNCRSR